MPAPLNIRDVMPHHSMNMLNLVIATTNPGKLREFRRLFADLPVDLSGLEDHENIPEPEETGRTFADNARLKAEYYARRTGMWSLADDSGLEVDALGGAPGVYSARYAGPGADDADNMRRLLAELARTGDADRKARFVCEMAVSDESGRIRFVSRGVCPGRIAERPRGSHGFGYDPVFVPAGRSATFGELSDEEKERLSHRSAAAENIIREMKEFLGF